MLHGEYSLLIGLQDEKCELLLCNLSKHYVTLRILTFDWSTKDGHIRLAGKGSHGTQKCYVTPKNTHF